MWKCLDPSGAGAGGSLQVDGGGDLAGGGRRSALTVTRRAEDHVIRSAAPAKTPTASFLISLAMPASFLSRQNSLSPAPRSYLRRAGRRGEKQAKPSKEVEASLPFPRLPFSAEDRLCE